MWQLSGPTSDGVRMAEISIEKVKPATPFKGTNVAPPLNLISIITGGFITGLLQVVLTISYAALVYGGELNPYLGKGIGYALGGAFIIAAVIALIDAIKGLKMFQDVEVPVLGVIENMSTHICSQCGHEEPIFGSGGGSRMAEQYGVPLLGQLPLALRIREDLDRGMPTVATDPDSPITASYREMARHVAGRLAATPRSLSLNVASINVHNS